MRCTALEHLGFGTFVVKQVFESFAVHHCDFSALYAVKLLAVGQVGMQGTRFIVAIVVGSGGGKVVFGRSSKVVCCHAVVFADGFALFLKKIFVGFSGSRFGVGGVFVGHRGHAKYVETATCRPYRIHDLYESCVTNLTQ
jgi:hypothetical protein